MMSLSLHALSTAPTAALRQRHAAKPRAVPLRSTLRVQATAPEQRPTHKLARVALAASLSALVAATTVAPDMAFAVRTPTLFLPLRQPETNRRGSPRRWTPRAGGAGWELELSVPRGLCGRA
jgi:hypothetical protein